MYGEKESNIILNTFLPLKNKTIPEIIANRTGFTLEHIEYVQKELREDYLSAFTNEEMINKNDDNRANAFFKRLIQFGNEQMADFVGTLMRFPVYNEIIERIGEAFPDIGQILADIRLLYKVLDDEIVF